MGKKTVDLRAYQKEFSMVKSTVDMMGFAMVEHWGTMMVFLMAFYLVSSKVGHWVDHLADNSVDHLA